MGGCTLPHELQKCTATMVPHDQQLGVASPGACPGMISDDLDSAFAITQFRASARPALSPLWLCGDGPGARPDGAEPRHHTIYAMRTNCRSRRTWSSSDSRTRIP